MFDMHFTMHCLPIQPDLDWKTRYKKLLGSAPLVIAIPGWADRQTGHERDGRGQRVRIRLKSKKKFKTLFKQFSQTPRKIK
jgi:hypothetical protein